MGMSMYRFCFICILLSLPLIGAYHLPTAANIGHKSAEDYLGVEDLEKPTETQVAKLVEIKESYLRQAARYGQESRRALFTDNGWARQLKRKAFRYEQEAKQVQTLINHLQSTFQDAGDS